MESPPENNTMPVNTTLVAIEKALRLMRRRLYIYTHVSAVPEVLPLHSLTCHANSIVDVTLAFYGDLLYASSLPKAAGVRIDSRTPADSLTTTTPPSDASVNT